MTLFLWFYINWQCDLSRHCWLGIYYQKHFLLKSLYVCNMLLNSSFYFVVCKVVNKLTWQDCDSQRWTIRIWSWSHPRWHVPRKLLTLYINISQTCPARRMPCWEKGHPYHQNLHPETGDRKPQYDPCCFQKLSFRKINVINFVTLSILYTRLFSEQEIQ